MILSLVFAYVTYRYVPQLQVILSLVFAYGVYILIFNFPFFPFLNLTGVYICIGIGADDVFVFLAAYDEM